MKNIHIIPTEKPSKLVIDTIENKLYLQPILHEKTVNVLTQNIYITSNEEIKEGDWYLFPLFKGGYEIKQYNSKKHFAQESCISLANLKAKKIILTTDQDLIADNVQAIDDEFLEWFVNNPSCESVETIYGLFNPMGRQVDPNNLGQNHSQCIWKHKIIIPQEEPKQDYIGVHLRHCYQGEYEDGCKYGEDDCSAKPLEEPKQETLEEAADLWATDTKNVHPADSFIAKQSFIQGAKWKQEKMYSEEEVEKIAKDAYEMGRKNILIGVFNKWFKQFKKK